MNEILPDTNELSYTVLDVNKIDNDTMYHDLASLINVRLAYQDHSHFPFLPFEKFEILLKADKLFIHGPAGSGKSRCILEILNKNFDQYRKIFVINPRSTTLGKHGTGTLTDIVSKFEEYDAVIWDNFPDDLRKKDLRNSIATLELISSISIKQLIVSLKPTYLEVFATLANNIPEFYPFGISYSKNEFKRILKEYGTNIPQYQNAYYKFLEPNLEKIANSLWQKEPTPLTILDYYNEVIIKESEMNIETSNNVISQKNITENSIDHVSLAENLPRSIKYYDHQFVLLNHMQDRSSDVEFLYTLKLCYELQLDRDQFTIEQLQRKIFGSNLRSYPKLRNWIYFSGHICSMHDVCRDAITFTDDLRSKFLQYITNNFIETIDDSNPARVKAIASFLGKNIQFLPLDKMPPFIPRFIYKYMKINPQFEKWFGRSVGDVFELLDEDLQKVITSRVNTDMHFAMGIGESLGYRFSSLKRENQILKRINDDFLFARYFGQSLGRLFPYLPDNVRKEVSYSCTHNPQLSDGLGMGIGFIYETLSPNLKREMFTVAETNSEMMRGFGYGFGLRFSKLEEKLQHEIFSIACRWSEFDFGLGFALGEQYKSLELSLQKRILDRIQTTPLFSFGVGLYAGFSDPNNCPSELMTKMNSNGGLAFGFGLGFGISFTYLTSESRVILLSMAKRNIRLDIGLAEGIGLSFNFQEDERRKRYLLDADSYAALAEGLAIGIGNTWIYNGSDVQKQAISKIGINNLFAYGLGFGIGHRMKYLDEKVRNEVFLLADRNSEMDKGLGLGLGMVFPYLGILKNELISRAYKKTSFAYGLGTGLGWIFKYLSSEDKRTIQSISSSNRIFAQGLGYGIGIYTINHCDNDLIDQFFSQIREDSEYARGLGEGIGYSFGYFSKSLRKKIWIYALTSSPKFAKGLGVGLGRTFSYLSSQIQSNILKRAEYNVNFAEGLGEGMAITFNYMNDVQRDQLFSKGMPESAFVRGVGIGLGSIFNYLQPRIQNEIMFRRTIQNSLLAKGLGIGLGSIFNYLSSQIQSNILKRAEYNVNFAEGLGEGIGSIIMYMDSPIKKEFIQRAQQKRNPSFMTGFGIGLGLTWRYHDTFLQDIINTLLNKEFTKGFGIGIANILHCLPIINHSRLTILEMVEKFGEFAESFGFGIGYLFSYLNETEKTNMMLEEYYPYKSTHFAYGLGKGLGHNFLQLDDGLKEQVFQRVNHYHFGLGLGESLGRIFDGLENIIQDKLFEYASLNSTFAYGLGKGLGQLFPTLSRHLQARVLDAAENGLEFTSGLVTRLEEGTPYLDEDIRNIVIDFIERNKNNSSRTDLLGGYHDDLIYNEYPVVGLKGRIQQQSKLQEGQHFRISLPLTKKEVVFLGTRKSCCVCFVDIVKSTIIANTLKQEQIQSYYAIFLNSMATISKNFNARIIKSQGDALFLYFPRTSLVSIKPIDFKGVLECGITMLAAHKVINGILYHQKLPPLDYRISADYGILEEARSVSSNTLDLFGPAMNLCAKINSKAPKNEMVIGRGLYDIIKSFLDINSFKESEGVILGDGVGFYPVFQVINNYRNILNPFKHTLN
jgi:class 3 adenylate cyclase